MHVFSVLGGRKIVLSLLLLDHIRGGTAGALEAEYLLMLKLLKMVVLEDHQGSKSEMMLIMLTMIHMKTHIYLRNVHFTWKGRRMFMHILGSTVRLVFFFFFFPSSFPFPS